MKLCFECREYWKKHFNREDCWPMSNPSLHCHHSEPQEKQKESCWCSKPTFCYVLVGEQTLKAQFCPVCKKPSEEWGK